MKKIKASEINDLIHQLAVVSLPQYGITVIDNAKLEIAIRQAKRFDSPHELESPPVSPALIPDWVERARTRLGLSQTTLARIVGLRPEHISRLERNRRKLPSMKLNQLINFLQEENLKLR
jgi:Predicted transcriptional regulators